MARNRPSAAELTDAVNQFLQEEVDGKETTPAVKFKLRVATNVLGIVSRECRLGVDHDRQEQLALQQLLNDSSTDLSSLNESFCKELRSGSFDGKMAEVLAVLTDTTMNKLSIDNPRYSTFLELKDK